MDLMMEIIILLVGFVFLIKGADYFIDGSSAVAKKLKVPSIVVGLTIVAIGTSLPELAVSAFAAAKGSNAIAFSNVIGSNIFNLLMVLGVSSIFIKVNVKESILKREFPFLLVITITAMFFAGDALWYGNIFGNINIFKFKYGNEYVGTIERVEGILLLLLFVAFIWWTVSYALKERQKSLIEEEDTLSNMKCVLYILGGACAIVLGGELVVDNAESIALAVGMSETLVGLTIVAMGTSLPELVTSAVAAKKGEADIAVGNVVGSNIANILLVLGLSATISPVSINAMSIIDALSLIVITLVVFILSLTKKSIKRSEGIFIVLLYFVYLAYIICRQM